MRALDKKLLRDMRRLWAQSLAVALVMAAGVATLLIGVGAQQSLFETRQTYYERSQFAHVFASVVRAPKSVMDQLRRLEGVAQAEPRIVKSALLDAEGFELPITGQFISLPAHGEPNLNKLYVRTGRLPEPGSTNEVAVNDAFAKAHRFVIGSKFGAILNGSKRQLTITGTVLSPEIIYARPPGGMMPDDLRYGVIFMREPSLAALYDFEGAFNDVSVRLMRNGDAEKISTEVDRILKRYGGEGAYARDEHPSHAFLDAELKQLKTMSRLLPPVFLVVTAFLINMVLARLISLEREQIGLLKAIGYSPSEIVAHYVKLVSLIATLGIALGFGAGTWLSFGLTKLYARFFHFPYEIQVISTGLYSLSAIISLAAALAGASRSVLAAASLSPAVAMQAPAPPNFKRVFSGSWRPLRHFSQLTIMVFRNLTRWPVRAFLTSAGISLSIAMLVSSLFSTGAINLMIDVIFDRTDRQDITMNFASPRSLQTVTEIMRLPGVIATEPYRIAPVRLSNAQHEKRTAIIGKPETLDISRVLDQSFQPFVMPRYGLVLTETLADSLHAKKGEPVHLEFLGSSNVEADVPVVAIVQGLLGLSAYMDANALSRLLGESPQASGIHILLDSAKSTEFFRAIKKQPTLSSVQLQRVSLETFRKTIRENIVIQVTVYVSLAVVVAFGVTYNSARIQFSERARDLASLRVLGFTEYEVSTILLLEYVVLTAIAAPIGCVLGYGLAYALTMGFRSELYRLPFIVERSTFAYSMLIVIAAVAATALIVRRRVSNLDLVEVLKTRD
jgi:putative ABC transport system permease protein